MFNQTVTVEPLSSVRVTAVVKNYHVSCDYNALVEGRSGDVSLFMEDGMVYLVLMLIMKLNL